MNTRVCTTALVLLAGTTQVMAANPLAAATPVAAPAPTPARPAAPAPAAAQPGDDAKGSQPPIVVHKDQTAADTRDGRVDMGGVKISMGWGAPGPAVSPSGLIHVPSNTLGPGEALWRADDRQDAQLKLATAAADIARTEAERPNIYDRYDSRYGPYGVLNWFGGGFGGFGGYGGYGGYAPAPYVQMHGGPGVQPEHGPGAPPAGAHRASTGATPSNAIGSTAQMAFAAAAYPRLGAAQARATRA